MKLDDLNGLLAIVERGEQDAQTAIDLINTAMTFGKPFVDEIRHAFAQNAGVLDDTQVQGIIERWRNREDKYDDEFNPGADE